MLFAKKAVGILALAGATLITACSSEQPAENTQTEPATVESAATPEVTPQAAATPAPTPDDRTRTERVAEHQRRVQELVRQKQLERAQQQAPGTETQYQ